MAFAYAWKTATKGVFSTSSNWSSSPGGGTFPGAESGDEALITATGKHYTVTSNASETILDFATSEFAALDITNNSTFTATNGTGENNNAGIVKVEAGSDLEIGGTLNNSGRIVSFGTTNITATINNNLGQLASGTGGILNISNSTVTQIPIVVSDDVQLPASASEIRAGTVPKGGGTTNLTDSITGGTVAVRSSRSVLNLDGTTIATALLDTQYGGSMNVIGAGATFNSIVNTGYVHVTDGTTLTLQGTINNETACRGEFHRSTNWLLPTVGNGR
jgi:hypothetical protein